MDNEHLATEILNILQAIKPQTVIRHINLFGTENNFTSRDIAYVLLEIERKFDVDIAQIVTDIARFPEGYTVEALTQVVAMQKHIV